MGAGGEYESSTLTSLPTMQKPLTPGAARSSTITQGATSDDVGTVADAPKVRGRLFYKYVALFVAVVSLALLANGIFEVYFFYKEYKSSLIRLQREQADAGAAKIAQFLKEIQGQLGWTTQLSWSAQNIEQRRSEALRLLHQVPAISKLSQLDESGKERLRVSRLDMNVVDSGDDYSVDPKFTEAVAHKVYYGPVYFLGESEPYMTLAISGARRAAGVSVAEVNLKLIWEVVSQIKVGKSGHAYVVDARGRLIAYPDISLVLRNTDLSRLRQVSTALNENQNPLPDQEPVGSDLEGRQVLAAHAAIAPPGWLLMVELPFDEAYAPLYASLLATGLVLLVGLALAVLSSFVLARRMVTPIQVLQAGADRIGGGS